MKDKIKVLTSSLPSIDIKSLKKRVDEIYKPLSDKVVRKRIGTNVRDYFNGEENERFTWFFITTIFADVYRKNAVAHGNITKEEHRHLKTALTHFTKYTELVMSRLNPKARRIVEERIAIDDLKIKIIDRRTSEKFNDLNLELGKHIRIESPIFFDWCGQIMRINCCNCRISCEKCRDIYDVFRENYVAESGENLKNCPYAYDKDFKSVDDNLQLYVQSLEEMIKERTNLVNERPHRKILYGNEIKALELSVQVLHKIKAGEITINEIGGE